jgi:hypothetical protein
MMMKDWVIKNTKLSYLHHDEEEEEEEEEEGM